MTDENNEESNEEEKEGEGLGNLPPLSDFDSEEDKPEGNLPPQGDLSLDTPAGGLDTPDSASGLGFQDLAADSDFSPETPDMGPGPESDIQTPMSDSAFGGDSGGFGSGDQGGDTGAPTQAMETPMFDASPSPAGGGGFGFDQGAFGGASGGGTPAPDTGVFGGMGVTPTPQPIGGVSGGGEPSSKTVALVGLVALLIGIGAGPYLSNYLEFWPTPQRQEADKQRDDATRLGAEASGLRAEIRRLTDTAETNVISLEEIQRRVDLSLELDVKIAELQPQVRDAENQLQLINQDVEDQNLKFTKTQEALEDARTEMQITKTRNDGLVTENDRLEVAVGGLEDANARRKASQDTLLHSMDRLLVHIKEGISLTPGGRYSQADRLAKAEVFREKVAGAKWVSPAILNEYTGIWLLEQEISQSREYFFAKIPVHDELGSELMKWAECIMNGNWSVYWRTIDGLHVGSYEDISGTNAKEYAFREGLPATVQAEIGDQVTAARGDDFADQLIILQSKQAVYETKTPQQRVFDSL